MKLVKVIISLVLFWSHAEFLFGQKPRTGLSEWHNKVEKADMSIKDNICIITLYCQKNPICFYMPQTLLESNNPYKKRYVLPRTTWSSQSLDDFMTRYKKQLNDLDINCTFYTIARPNFGLGLLFEIDAERHHIEKNIDDEYKMVQFTITIKK